MTLSTLVIIAATFPIWFAILFFYVDTLTKALHVELINGKVTSMGALLIGHFATILLTAGVVRHLGSVGGVIGLFLIGQILAMAWDTHVFLKKECPHTAIWEQSWPSRHFTTLRDT